MDKLCAQNIMCYSFFYFNVINKVQDVNDSKYSYTIIRILWNYDAALFVVKSAKKEQRESGSVSQYCS